MLDYAWDTVTPGTFSSPPPKTGSFCFLFCFPPLLFLTLPSTTAAAAAQVKRRKRHTLCRRVNEVRQAGRQTNKQTQKRRTEASPTAALLGCRLLRCVASRCVAMRWQVLSGGVGIVGGSRREKAVWDVELFCCSAQSRTTQRARV
ncbi:hypothetical protein LZ31DRAFT_257321 [Colletotrichum somersetense]|nr:hypothetical protein LZ31DRAFT_257321 [Colletotrichum somersetense]